MPAEINGNYVHAHLKRARVYLQEWVQSSPDYYSCGSVTVTPSFVFVNGHGNKSTEFEPIVSMGIPVEQVRIIVDASVEACETHDEMDAEAKAQMESLQNAEESKED